MSRQQLPYLDWLKAIGLGLVVYGHVAAASSVWLTPPVYPKQLGVALFVFATGVTLARESRPSWLVVFNRTFEVWLFGLAAAVLMSVFGLLRWGDPNESNYLPLFGLHVALNDFPANPTTWYIGTYLHLLLVWALVLRAIQPGPLLLGAIVVAGSIVRAALIEYVGPFTGYMSLTNWLDVLLLGLMVGCGRFNPRHGFLPLACIVPLLWPVLLGMVGWQLTFPFMSLGPSRSDFGSTLLVSGLVSATYLTYTWSAFRITRWLPASHVAAFFARNSVIVFILHMPVYYMLEFVLPRFEWTYTVRVSVEFVVCLVGLAMVSELVRRFIRPNVLRAKLALKLSGSQVRVTEPI